MSLMRRNEQMPAWSNFLNEFFDRDWLDWSNRHFSDTNTTLPAVNIKERNDAYEVEMAAPGLKKDDFKIELHNGVLTISSERKDCCSNKEECCYTRREFSYQSFSRTFSLPDTIETEKIRATYDKGILKVTIPKKEEAKTKPARKIAIK